MKKVLCLIDALSAGGAERQMVGLASLLKNQGYEVGLATYLPSDFYLDLVNHSGVKHLSLDAAPNKLSKLLAVRKCVKSGHYDTIVAYKDDAAMLACLLKLTGCHISLIVSERVVTQTETIRDRVKFFLYRFADFIVSNSYSQTRFVDNYYPRLSSKVRLITNFTDTNHFSPMEKNPNRPLVILTAARIAEQKNIKRYLETIRLLKERQCNAKFIWLGRVEERQYADECCQLIKSLDIADIIEMRPPSPNIVEEYKACDVFCLPSIYEGFPNVICEAMSCGIPIVCSNICDNPLIVEEGKSGYLFSPYDVDEMAHAIQKICAMNHFERCKMGKYNRKVALARFSEENFVKKYMELIEGDR